MKSVRNSRVSKDFHLAIFSFILKGRIFLTRART